MKMTLNLLARIVIMMLPVILRPGMVSAYKQADLDQLLATNECRQCDLAGAPLAHKQLNKAILEGANLKGADLSEASLRMADLAGVDLQGANLKLAILEAADMFGANLIGADLEGAVLDGAYLIEARFEPGPGSPAPTEKLALAASAKSAVRQEANNVAAPRSELRPEDEETEIAAAPVSSSVPAPVTTPAVAPLVAREESSAPATRMAATRPTTARELNAPPPIPVPFDAPPVLAVSGKELMQRAALEQPVEPPAVVLDQAKMLEKLLETKMCVECDFSGMDLAKVKLKGAFLERANFEGANLAGANLKGANLKAANLRNANLQEADLTEADLYKADLEGANLAGAALKETALDGAYLGAANLVGVNLEAIRQ